MNKEPLVPSWKHGPLDEQPFADELPDPADQALANPEAVQALIYEMADEEMLSLLMSNFCRNLDNAAEEIRCFMSDLAEKHIEDL